MTAPEPETSRPAPPGLRERKKARTRRELADVALRLFAERGYDRVTAEEVAAAADVSLRTFYRYFPSKDDVLLADTADRLNFLRESFAAQPADLPAFAALRQALLSLAAVHFAGERERQLQRAKVVIDKPSLGARSPERQIEWEVAVAGMLAEHMGVGTADLRPRVAAAAALAAMRVAVQEWTDEGAHGDLDASVAEALDLIEDGFRHLDPVVPAKASGRNAKRRA